MGALFKSVKTRLSLTVAVIVLFYTALLLVLTYGLMRDTAARNSKELADTVLEEADTHVTRFFRNMEEVAESFAAYSAVLEQDIPRLRELILVNVWARRSYMRAMYLGTETGEMHEWGYGEGFVDNAPVFGPDYDPRKRPWYQVALEVDGFAVTDPYLYASIDDYGITCVLPVYDSQGERIGVLGLDIMVDALQSLVEDFEISMGGRVLMVDRSGAPIVNQFASPGNDELPEFVLAATESEREGRFFGDVDEVPHLFSFKENPVTGWTIFVGLPLPAIMATTYNGIRLSVMLNFLLMVLLLFTLEWSSHRMLIEPVEEMVATIGRIRDGDGSARIDLRRDDEFGLLGRSFNGLADRVEEYTWEMERKVRQRTDRLQTLQQENLRLRIIEEKERIYGYLHDSLGARLTNIFISNNVARSANGDEGIREDMHCRIEENAQAGLDDLKEILSGSMEMDRAMIDFRLLLELQIRRRLELMQIEFHFEGSADELNLLPRRIALEVEKILQELISNVLKHAEARRVDLSTHIAADRLFIGFRDDGRGFSLESVVPGCFGLVGLRNRAERLVGLMTIETAPGKGTDVTIELPLGSVPNETY